MIFFLNVVFRKNCKLVELTAQRRSKLEHLHEDDDVDVDDSSSSSSCQEPLDCFRSLHQFQSEFAVERTTSDKC